MLDKRFRGAKVGAAIGLVLGALVVMLFSRWLPDSFFGPAVLGTAVVFAVVFGLCYPMELPHRDLDDDPDCIAPADRVKRLQAEPSMSDDAGN